MLHGAVPRATHRTKTDDLMEGSSVFETGFARPRDTRASRTCEVDACVSGVSMAQGVFDWSDVTVFFTMCSEALSAKTAASEVPLQQDQ